MSDKPTPSAKDIVIKTPSSAKNAAGIPERSTNPTSGIEPDATDDSTIIDVVATAASHTKPGDSSEGAESTFTPDGQLIPATEINLSQGLVLEIRPLLGEDGRPYLLRHGGNNPYCLLVGSRTCNNLIRRLAQRKDITLSRSDLQNTNDSIRSYAETEGSSEHVWSRVAPITNGVEIDLGDDKDTRIRITAGKVETIAAGSTTLFYRTPISRPMVRPADRGDLKLLDKYLNLSDPDILLLKAWMSYTLAHPKRSTSKFLILLLQGEQGTGKTLLCGTIQKLIDPNVVGVQILPTSYKDLAIAAQNAHVLAFDNVRGFKQSMADMLCIASTGGAMSFRQLYTDADLAFQRLHAALVLNGIHDFVNQPDLAQRCLPVYLKPLKAGDRRSEAEIAQAFEADLPMILRGLFDLISKVLSHHGKAKITNPERMIDFTKWLAAMEVADDVPAGTFQALYSEALSQVQRDTLLDSPLAAAVLNFAAELGEEVWKGTPTKLLEELNSRTSYGDEQWRYWPKNPIALSKRLKPLLGGLRDQGIDIQMTRGKERQITIKVLEGFDNA